jgi:gamma-glutamyl hercynylcysteine S-oxide synthase
VPRLFVPPSLSPRRFIVSIAVARPSGHSALGGDENVDGAPDIVSLLADIRARTVEIVSGLSEEDAVVQHDPLMSPVVWDLGHIAGFEELWLLRHLERPLEGLASIGEMPGVFNPFEHPRRTRGGLKLPGLKEALEALAGLRCRVLERLTDVDCGPDAPPLTRDGYVYRMVAQHEAQHGETILQTLQLKGGEPFHPSYRRPIPVAGAPAEPMVRFPGGRVRLGTADRSAAYDNERPSHEVDLAPFDIDATPVTNGAYLEFVESGGYRTPRWWSSEGAKWLSESGVEAPKHWHRSGGEWWTRAMDDSHLVDPAHPVVHVCYFEAEAFARWAGKRLPTELEWEAAATWDPGRGVQRRYPWGDAAPTDAIANIDQVSYSTTPVGAYARNVSPIGCRDMIGNVWEWTASDFGPYPGFVSFPYREYSEAFFGPEYKVLRGGSWATRAIVSRSTFRNWDYPIRRQIFSGFRCARDA